MVLPQQMEMVIAIAVETFKRTMIILKSVYEGSKTSLKLFGCYEDGLKVLLVWRLKNKKQFEYGYVE